MKLQAVIFDPTYTTVYQSGVIPLVGAEVERVLDKVGRVNATFPLVKEAMEHLDSRRVVEVWVYPEAGENLVKRRVGIFIVDDLALREEGDQVVYSVSGNDLSEALRNEITLPGLVYDNDTVADVIDDLVGLAGWTASKDAGLSSVNISLRLAGDSVKRAIEAVCEFQGIHWRLDSGTADQIEVGAFGDSAGVTIEYMWGGNPADYTLDADLPMAVSRIECLETSQELVNQVYVYGAGDGDAALSLDDLSSAHKGSLAGLGTTSANGRTHYYIADATSVSAYGAIKRRLNIKRISAVGTSDTQINNAAKALYDAGYEWLQRHKDPYEKFLVTCVNVTSSISAGDKVHLRVKGRIRRRGDSGLESYQYKDVDGEYWVVKVVERFSDDGAGVLDLELASVDRMERDASDIVVGATDAIEVNNVSLYPTLNYYVEGPHSKFVTAGDTTNFVFKIRGQTMKVNAVTLTIRRFAERQHGHLIFQVLNESLFGTTEASPRIFQLSDGASNYQMLGFTNAPVGTVFKATPTSDDYTGSEASLPEDLDISVNGSSVATGLWAGTQVGTTQEYDITSEIQSTTLRGEHTIAVTCGTNYGWVEIEVGIEDQISMIGAQY